MRRLRAGRASLAIALAFAFALAQVGGALHVLLVEHVTCEHGDLIHVAGGHQQAPVRQAVTQDAGQSQPGDIHDHCVASQLTSGQSSIGTAPAAFAQPGPELTTLVLCAPLPPRASVVALYRLAPKTSPPARSAS